MRAHSVKMFASDISVGILASSTNQNNILAAPSAVSFNLSDLTESLIDGGLIEKKPVPLDLLLVYDKSVSAKNKPLLSYYYCYEAEGSPYNGWYEFGGENKVDDLVINSTEAVYIRKAALSKDPYINSSKFTPDYLE